MWNRPLSIIIITGIISAMALGGAFMVKFDYDFSKILATKELPSYALDKEISKIFNRRFIVPAIVITNKEEERKLIALLNKKMEEDEGGQLLERVVGLSTFIPEDQRAKLKEIRKIRLLIRDNRKYIDDLEPNIKKKVSQLEEKLVRRSIKQQDLPMFIQRNFQTKVKISDTRKVFIYSPANFEDGLEVLRFSDFLKSIQIEGKPVKVATDSLIFAEVLELIRGEGFWILILIFIIIYLLSVLNLASLFRGCIVLFPVILGLLLLLGSQGMFDIQINFLNVVIYPVAVGIGVDSGIHLYHRYLSSKGNMILSVQTTGEAVSLSALTTFLGFGALCFSNNEAVKSMGILAALGIGFTYIASVVVLPSVILIKDKFRKG